MNQKKRLILKKPCDNIDSVCYEDLDDYEDLDEYNHDDKYRKIGSIRRLFKGFNSNYYKPIITDRGFDGRENNYKEYMSKGDRYENLSPKKYLNLIRPYLRDLINKHKPTAELNNNNNSNNRAEWTIQLKMHINCISTRSLKINVLCIQKVNQQKFLWAATQTM